MTHSYVHRCQSYIAHFQISGLTLWLCGVQRKGHARAGVSLNMGSPRTPKQPQESNLNCSNHFEPCYDVVEYDVSERQKDLAMPCCALCESSQLRWGNTHCEVRIRMCGEGEMCDKL